MTLIINGMNITRLIAREGLKYSVNDVDKDAGRTMDGKMHRGRIATKIRLDVKLLRIKEATLQTILGKLSPESFSVTYTDPKTGANQTKTMYSNNYSATLVMEDETGVRYYDDFEFPLIEI